ncbi:hypothetical protein mRhiFer1_009075 [Rhinolophus ferrumequinum]|uniref:Uncharacterized protein n=1 Tax=Rhinolophus ferrumequinum TaxID=59479 RepID=A0A7J7SXM6_RHIFE|nr:hypothetical protein mRhiFer1_009075 [Rhinolophus ferrumequinum]
MVLGAQEVCCLERAEQNAEHGESQRRKNGYFSTNDGTQDNGKLMLKSPTPLIQGSGWVFKGIEGTELGVPGLSFPEGKEDMDVDGSGCVAETRRGIKETLHGEELAPVYPQVLDLLCGQQAGTGIRNPHHPKPPTSRRLKPRWAWEGAKGFCP